METHVMPASFNNGPVEEGFPPGRKARKEYKCHACDRVFKRSEHFTRHVRVHTKERPFSCRFCQKTYGRKDLVRRHEKTLHADLCESAALDNTSKSSAKTTDTRTDAEVQQDFNLNHAAYMSNQPYPMHEQQDGQLYSPATEHSSNYDHMSVPPAPPSIPPSQDAGQEALLIDPMLDEAFAAQGSSNQFAQSHIGLYHDGVVNPESSPYYHPTASNSSFPSEPTQQYSGDAGPTPEDSHTGPRPATHALHDGMTPDQVYANFDAYQQPYPPDYQ